MLPYAVAWSNKGYAQLSNVAPVSCGAISQFARGWLARRATLLKVALKLRVTQGVLAAPIIAAEF
jgi:hypothetical protein